MSRARNIITGEVGFDLSPEVDTLTIERSPIDGPAVESSERTSSDETRGLHLARPDLIVGRHDELDVREDVFEQLAELSAVVGIHGGDDVVENGEPEVRFEELPDQGQVEADPHPVLVTFAVVGHRWEHAEPVEVDFEVELPGGG